MNILDKIVQAKIVYLEEQKKTISEKQMREYAKTSSEAPSFRSAVAVNGLAIIGEIKKASPSKGIIDSEFDYMKIAQEYNVCVDAVSVLTEVDYFMGKPEYLSQIARIVNIPILRKDFIIDSYQIFESKVLGASCVLLIVSLLDSRKLKTYIELCMALGMDSLVEVHDEAELYRAIRAGAEIIGINNRNLKDFSIDLRMTKKIGALVPENILCIGESGINTAEDAAFIKTTRADGILVGESFMRSGNKSLLAERLRNA